MPAGKAQHATVTMRLDPIGHASTVARMLGYDTHAISSTLLYRFHDHDGHLLYVGVTNRPAERWGTHRRKAPWWPLARHVTVTRYAANWLALDAERAAIRFEGPIFNRRSAAL